MNNKTILNAIDDMLSELDLMTDEELHAEYDNLNYGPLGRVFIEAEDFFAFSVNESNKEHIMPMDNFSKATISKPVDKKDTLTRWRLSIIMIVCYHGCSENWGK